jgi:hypothetical protein
MYVAHAYAQFHRNERLVACGIQRTRHTDHALPREAAILLGDVAHRIERVGDDDQDRVRAIFCNFRGHVRNDLFVDLDQFVAAGEFARHRVFLARDARRDHDDIGVCCCFVAVRSHNIDIEADHRPGFEQVQRFTLRDALYHVYQYHVRDFADRHPCRQRRTNISCADNRDFLARHFEIYS